MSKSRARKPVTPAWLENVALHYLERFASSAEHLRRVLLRRVERRRRLGGAEEAPPEESVAAHAAMVEEVVARLVRSGLLDDARYAEAHAASLHRRGASLSAIRRKLASRGVAAEMIAGTLAGLTEDAGVTTDEADLAAALALARRRRLGPFRAPELRAEFRQRDLAALGRAGFSYEIARAVLEAEDAP